MILILISITIMSIAEPIFPILFFFLKCDNLLINGTNSQTNFQNFRKKVNKSKKVKEVMITARRGSEGQQMKYRDTIDVLSIHANDHMDLKDH